MEFNTLHAQREACEAYVISQRAEGWKTIETEYNDGGYSGGNLNRPAMQRLLTDIKAGKVQTVVVYKIDRLTRSLMDFSKLVEIFDEYGVTFVSVTQSFNTTTSMGRLTLNVLLSFAQFEREVSAERIRDKIAASKKKGMWMGGVPPIGYEVIDKKLIIHQDDAKIALHIFERYLTLGNVATLKHALDAKGITSIKRLSKRGKTTGGKHFSRGALYTILQNPIYIGKIRHKDKIYDGIHEAIISQELWEDVQEKLKSQSTTQRGHKKAADQNLLKGLLFDCDNTRYSPSFAKKAGKRYRYYISQNLIQHRNHPKGAMARIPAHDIEKLVISTMQNNIIETLALNPIDDHATIKHITDHTLPTEPLVVNCIDKITVDNDVLNININVPKLHEELQSHLNLNIPNKYTQASHLISTPFTKRRSYKGAVILRPETTNYDLFDLPPAQLKNLVRGVVWRDEHFAGMSMMDIAKREGLSQAGIRKIIMASFDTLLSA